VPIVLGFMWQKMAGMPQIVILKAQKILKKRKNHSSDMLNGIKSEKMKCK
jgi:DNA mismatch repair protein MutS